MAILDRRYVDQTTSLVAGGPGHRTGRGGHRPRGLVGDRARLRPGVHARARRGAALGGAGATGPRWRRASAPVARPRSRWWISHVLPRATPPDGVLLRAPTIDVSVDIASLWRRELTLSLLATDLDLDMTAPPTKADGPGIFPLPPYVEIGPLRVGIGSVRLRGGHAVIRDPEAAWTLEVAGADVTARPSAGDLDVSGRLDALRVEALGRREQIERVAVDGRLAADVLRIRKIDWHWEGDAMQLDGEIRRPWLAEPRGVPAPQGRHRPRGAREGGRSRSADRRQGAGRRRHHRSRRCATDRRPRPDPRARPCRGHGSGRRHRG